MATRQLRVLVALAALAACACAQDNPFFKTSFVNYADSSNLFQGYSVAALDDALFVGAPGRAPNATNGTVLGEFPSVVSGYFGSDCDVLAAKVLWRFSAATKSQPVLCACGPPM